MTAFFCGSRLREHSFNIIFVTMFIVGYYLVSRHDPVDVTLVFRVFLECHISSFGPDVRRSPSFLTSRSVLDEAQWQSGICTFNSEWPAKLND